MCVNEVGWRTIGGGASNHEGKREAMLAGSFDFFRTTFGGIDMRRVSLTARGCGPRVAILYGGGIVACRHCYQLAYPRQRVTGYDRMARRASYPGKAEVEARHSQRQRLEAQGGALEHLRAADRAA